MTTFPLTVSRALDKTFDHKLFYLVVVGAICAGVGSAGGASAADSIISLQSHHGRYLVAESNHTVNANRTAIGPWEKWTRIDNGDGTVSFKSAHGRYLVAESNHTVNANRTAIGPWEKWTPVDNGDGTVSFRSAHGRYLVAESNHTVNANRTAIGPWEKWTLLESAKVFNFVPGAGKFESGTKYYSASGKHYFQFTQGSGFGVYGQDDQLLLEGRTLTNRQAEIETITYQADGNLVARGAADAYIWSALTTPGDRRDRLVLTDAGQIQLWSSRDNTVRWSSDGNTAGAIDLDQVAGLKAAINSCKAGLTTLSANMYRYPAKPDAAGQGGLSWNDAFRTFTAQHRDDCDTVGTFLRAHGGRKFTQPAATAMAAHATARWADFFNTNAQGILFHGGRIGSYCPGLHRSQYDCVSGPERVSKGIAGATAVMDALDKIECVPVEGYFRCRSVKSGDMTVPMQIFGSKATTSAGMDLADTVYKGMTGALKTRNGKTAKVFNGYVVYLTNGESKADIEKAPIVGTMWPTTGDWEKTGDFLRGGASPDFLWISEQMMCKTGVATRNATKANTDNAVRTVDQVVHEFGHSIDFNYGLSGSYETVFPDIMGMVDGKQQVVFPAVEAFAVGVQSYFNAPSGTLNSGQTQYLGTVFSGRGTFSCASYNAANP